MSIIQMLLCTAGATIVIPASTTDLNLFAAAGSPVSASTFTFIIPAGVTIGQASGAAAVNFGQFPAGSEITVLNSGNVWAKGGAANGGAGGDAIKADYANQKMTWINQSGGSVRAGGGGGGKGGTGGTGGTGGQGSYSASAGEQFSTAAPAYYWRDVSDAEGVISAGTIMWNGTNVGSGTGVNSGVSTYNGYTRESFRSSSTTGSGLGTRYNDYYGVSTIQTLYTNGGAGGGGGAGGNGGRGQGYDGAQAGGASGGGGTVGSAGGTNAGSGGTGGTGGVGGGGGTWAQPGGASAAGNTGGTGATGNYTGGSAGTVGGGASSGGAAGRAAVKASANFTLTNSGEVLGAVA